MKTDMILLFSGGIDSLAAWHFLDKPKTLYFDAKTRYSQKERVVVQSLIPNTIIEECISFRDREIGDKAYVPFRNLIFACLAAKYSDRIIIAGVKDDQVSDKNEQIFHEFSALLTRMEGRNIIVESPWWGKTKAEVVGWFLKNVPNAMQLLTGTTSCYDAKKAYCGKCPSCFRKWNALWENGIKIDFFNYGLMDEYRQSALDGKYIRQRNMSIIKCVEEFKDAHNMRRH